MLNFRCQQSHQAPFFNTSSSSVPSPTPLSPSRSGLSASLFHPHQTTLMPVARCGLIKALTWLWNFCFTPRAIAMICMSQSSEQLSMDQSRSTGTATGLLLCPHSQQMTFLDKRTHTNGPDIISIGENSIRRVNHLMRIPRSHWCEVDRWLGTFLLHYTSSSHASAERQKYLLKKSNTTQLLIMLFWVWHRREGRNCSHLFTKQNPTWMSK